MQTTSDHASQAISAERRLKKLGIHLPVPPEPFETYSEAVQVGSLLFLSGTLPTEGRTAKFVGRLGGELDAGAGSEAARLAAMNAVAIARQRLGSLDRVKRIVRLGVSVATEGSVREQPKVAGGASSFLQEVFGPDEKSYASGVLRSIASRFSIVKLARKTARPFSCFTACHHLRACSSRCSMASPIITIW
jgi:enamine deaminase RidA (YjgF/YER057c/UK114 family)